MAMAETQSGVASCPVCGGKGKRSGVHRNGLRRFRCTACKKTYTEDHQARFRIEDYLKEKRGIMAIRMLLEGSSIRTVERLTDIHRDSIMKLLVIAGQRCEAVLDRVVRSVAVEDVQADEVWSYVYCKEKNKLPENAHNDSIGDCYTWIALDRKSKLVLAYSVGRRTNRQAMDLMYKLRLATSDDRFQLSTDGLMSYVIAVDEILGDRVDFAQLVKQYAQPREGEQRYSPAPFVAAYKVPVSGNPDPDRICTSHVERFNLTMRMSIRRMTRLTNAFSKKLENHKAAVSLGIAYYNLCRLHSTIRITPAMEAGITDRVWSVEDLLSA